MCRENLLTCGIFYMCMFNTLTNKHHKNNISNAAIKHCCAQILEKSGHFTWHTCIFSNLLSQMLNTVA